MTQLRLVNDEPQATFPVDATRAVMGRLLLVPMPTGLRRWRDSAACVPLGVQADGVFYPAAEPLVDPWVGARAVCAACTVAGDCLSSALPLETPGNRHGMFGGMTPQDRDYLSGSVRSPSELGEQVVNGGVQARCPDCQQACSAGVEHVCAWAGGRVHGKYVTYRDGCRCDPCRDANAARRRRQAVDVGWRGQLRLVRPLPDIEPDDLDIGALTQLTLELEGEDVAC